MVVFVRAILLCLVSVCIQAASPLAPELPHVVQVTDRPPPAGDAPGTDPATNKPGRSVVIEDDWLVVGGQRVRLVSGSLHYFRVPAASWRDRLRKLRQAGLNAVATYVEWSFHEPEEREYKFAGDRDLAHFVRLAAEEGLLVLLRPGPYICAERDLGGFPYWILSKYPNIKLRTTDEDFIEETTVWLKKLFEEISPLLYGNGGPIILVQVENEYGSYGSDKAYMERSRDILAALVGAHALLYTTDGASRTYFVPGSVASTLTTIDFGTDTNVTSVFSALRKFMPKGPLMNSEFYPGWLSHWGEKFPRVNTKYVIQTLRAMLDMGASVNFYVFFGGTNFGFTAGANYFNVYQPDLTSYDYDAPLTEAGDPTPKYEAIRATLEEYYPEVKNMSRPSVSEKGAYGRARVRPVAALVSAEGRALLGRTHRPVAGSRLPTFEELRQNAGFVLYETKLTFNDTQTKVRLIKISKPRDRVYIYVQNELKGVISRMHKIFSLPLLLKSGETISFLVENQGRINFGHHLHDFKGILSTILIDNQVVEGGWDIVGYPLEVVNVTHVPNRITTSPAASPATSPAGGATLYRGTFSVPHSEPRDTFLDTTGWGKGYVWINGHNLGRYWPLEGPQMTLYVPGVWLRPALNTILLLELERSPAELAVTFTDRHVLDRLPSRTLRSANMLAR